jgi:glycosyltransferase involved in cell wall biosynthesis
LPFAGIKPVELWSAIEEAAPALPNLWSGLQNASQEKQDVTQVYQATLLARQATQRGIRHLHAHFATEATTVARIAAAFAGISYSFTAHAKDIYHQGAEWEDRRRKLHDASAVVTVSSFNYRYLHETFGAAANGVQRVYNGLLLDEFPYSDPRERPPIVVAVGRLVEKKGFIYLIDACALLANQGLDFQCWIVGHGECEKQLQARIVERGLTKSVMLLGPRPQAEVIRLVREAAVMAAPCVVGDDGNRDGLPTVLVEAMALGTPCVSTDVTGIPEIIHDGVTGFLVAQHDAPALAAAIARLLGDPQLRSRLARRARTLIEEHFDVHRNTAEMRRLFAAAASRAATADCELVEAS